VASSGVFAVIPARGGSKGLARKNLRLLGGIALVVHSIRAATGAKSIDRFVVSTEDNEIAALARSEGAQVIARPAELAGDTVQNNDVVRHAIAQAGAGFTYVALLQPTSPLRTSADIDACLRPLLAGAARSVMTVAPAEHHPAKAVRIEDGLVLPYGPAEGMEARRQDLPPAYRQNGAVYALAIADFLREDRFYLPPCKAIVMSAEASLDIDGEMDLTVAEALLARRGAAS
jgi:CMP-N-acetylneuraminic acid synthetase